ncbi:MAG: TrmB family transcriptional regulator sugar-binding domain-containing protein [Candidatus Fermentibacter sp.]|nr:TrmB family transcriptional regulator sugar-binding domain-containing protein [Candidatus Fermentibacter sp.]
MTGLKQTCTTLEASLTGIGGLPPEEGVYRLQNVPQVYARAAEIVRSARRNLLVDAYGIPLARIQQAVEDAASRGVTCLVHAHRDGTSVDGCEVIESCRTEIPGEWLAVMADGREYLIAVISSDEKRVYQAVWSRNPFIAPCVYQGYLNKAMFYRITLMFGAGKSREEIGKELNRLWKVYGSNDPGSEALNELLEHL